MNEAGNLIAILQDHNIEVPQEAIDNPEGNIGDLVEIMEQHHIELPIEVLADINAGTCSQHQYHSHPGMMF